MNKIAETERKKAPLKHRKDLDDKWIKASILGTIWASSEIVLGSFLHNLKVPFSGNILTAIGLIILISASYQWQEKGLFWRAGVICALLKTMSPSAVIFGPMIAIISEAFLLELSVRILGKTIPGILLGSILSMSWNLFQKIFNFIIFYGYNIVELYTNLMKYAQQELKLKFDVVWSPIILLLIVYALIGVVAAFVGIKTGRRLVKSPVKITVSYKNKVKDNQWNRTNTGIEYSILWLIFNVIFLIGALLLIGRLEFRLWLILSATIIITWAIRYKRALRQLIRPKLWIFFVIITMVTAFVFTRMQSDTITTSDAILIGVEMNVRAILLIMGFTVLGTELYHPRIREFLAKSYFKQLPPALELSLDSLPAMISTVPELKSILKNPVAVIHQLMSQAEFRIEEIKSQSNHLHKTIILTGEIGSGKTTYLKQLAKRLKNENFTIHGIYSRRIIKNQQTTGYKIVNISTGEKQPFLHLSGQLNQQKIGKYYIISKGLELGKTALNFNSFSSSDVIIIDEIGRLELHEKGWHESLLKIIQYFNGYLILSIRKEIVHEVIQKYELSPTSILEVSEINCNELYRIIVKNSQIKR